MDFSLFETEMETFFWDSAKISYFEATFFGYSNGELSNFKINDTVREWF